MNAWKPYFWRLVLTLLGLITAISFLILGFAKTFLILLCCAVGYVLGIKKDLNIRLTEILAVFRGKWR